MQEGGRGRSQKWLIFRLYDRGSPGCQGREGEKSERVNICRLDEGGQG